MPGTSRKLRVAQDVAPLLISFAKDFHNQVEPIDEGQQDDWGYAYREVRGSTLILSNHASGTAIDLNATKHPLGAANTFSDEQSATIRRLCRKYGLRWGGDYKSRKDEMHFEIALNQTQVV
ncbi:MAG: M15 family metallopeptidase, partial [Flammeovirgaceae bacterium]